MATSFRVAGTSNSVMFLRNVGNIVANSSVVVGEILEHSSILSTGEVYLSLTNIGLGVVSFRPVPVLGKEGGTPRIL
jgi:hypothetical protein